MHIVFVIVGLLSSLCAQHIAHYRLWCVVVDIGFAKLNTGRQLYNKTCDFFNTFMKLNEHGRT